MQKAHKSVRAGQYLRSLQRRIALSMEIRVHSRLFLARYNGCTNARCILSRSYGHEEFKNVNPFSMQKAHKVVRAGQYLRPLQRRIVPSMEIRVYSRLFPSRYKGCTNARCLFTFVCHSELFQLQFQSTSVHVLHSCSVFFLYKFLISKPIQNAQRSQVFTIA